MRIGLIQALRGCFGDIVSSGSFSKSHFRKRGKMDFRGRGGNKQDETSRQTAKIKRICVVK